MAVRQASAGINRWYSADGTSWGTSRNTDTGLNLWRIGTPDDLRALAGLAIRGWDIRGSVQGPVRSTIELLGLQGCAYPQPRALITSTSRSIYTVHEATSLPIGAIPSDGDFDVVGSPEWIGLYTPSYVTRRETDEIPYPVVGQFVLMVSPKPRWSVDVASAIDVGQETEARVTVEYPDGEKVVGLQLQLSAGPGTEVRSAGEFGATARAYTNSSGVATFRIRGVASAPTSSMLLTPVPLVNLRANMFSPDLPGAFELEVRPSPAAPPPQGGCVTFPAQPAIPHVPSSIRETPNLGWNAGANSAAELDGDVLLGFDCDHSVGVVIGLTQNRDIEAVGSIERITHGIYFHATAAGQYIFRVMESGRLVTPSEQHVTSDWFEIQRADSVVSYLRNGVPFYQSRVTSSGMVSAACALYSSGDTVPGGES